MKRLMGKHSIMGFNGPLVGVRHDVIVTFPEGIADLADDCTKFGFVVIAEKETDRIENIAKDPRHCL